MVSGLYMKCLIASPHFYDRYDGMRLSFEDKQRIARNPALEDKTDWRVSRALKQYGMGPVLSLSHSRGFAALLTADAGGAVMAGVDLEYMRERDFSALAQWICHPQEYAFLQGRNWKMADFYRLWCLKEALIKAAGLAFPSDMCHVGYCFSGGEIVGLHVNGHHGWRGVHAVLHVTEQASLMVGCVWQSVARVTVLADEMVGDWPAAVPALDWRSPGADGEG